MRSRRQNHDWSGEPPERPRVVIECPPQASPSIIADVIERHGMAVRVCGGPDVSGGCDLIDHGSCSLVTNADVVVNMLGQHHEGGRQVAAAVQAERRPPAVVLEMSQRDLERSDVDTADAVILPQPLRSAALIEAIKKALAKRETPTPRWEG